MLGPFDLSHLVVRWITANYRIFKSNYYFCSRKWIPNTDLNFSIILFFNPWCAKRREEQYQDGFVVFASNNTLLMHIRRRAYINFDSLQWSHNGHDSVSNHQSHDCLLNRLFRRRSKKTSKLRVTGLCVGNSPGTGEFPAQMASNAENVSIWWRHHVKIWFSHSCLPYFSWHDDVNTCKLHWHYWKFER